MSAAKSIGFIRRDLSGIRQDWHEALIRSHAKKLGYNLCKTVVLSARTRDPISQLIATLDRCQATAVFIPDLTHLDGSVPPALAATVAVHTITPPYCHPRRLLYTNQIPR